MVRHAEDFMDGLASMAENYFNASGVASEQYACLECENAELWDRWMKLETDNSDMSQRL